VHGGGRWPAFDGWEGFSEPVVVRIAVVDPLPMFREGVSAILAGSGHTVETPSDLTDWARPDEPSVVLLTVVSKHDWKLLGELCDAAMLSVIVVLADDESVLLGARAIRAGARSVLPRRTTANTLRRTVEATIGGQAVMPAAVAAALAADDQAAGGAGPSIDQLSWLHQLAEGSTVAQLANRVGYSERAMFRMLQALYRQIGVQTRLQAIIRAQEAGWL
jgi:DNA-binding NarL/FixJ family response regulator